LHTSELSYLLIKYEYCNYIAQILFNSALIWNESINVYGTLYYSDHFVTSSEISKINDI